MRRDIFRFPLSRALAFGAVLCVAPSASAATIFSIELEFGDVQFSSALPVSDTLEFHSGFEGTNFYSHRAFGSAGRGLLQVSSEASLQLTPAVTLGLGLVLNSTDAAAGFRLDDVIVSGPGTSVFGALNLDLEGSLLSSAFAQLGEGIGSEATSSASVSVFVGIAGTNFSGTKAISSVWQVETGSGDGSTFEDGLLTGFTGAGGIITPAVLLPVGTPFSIVMSLSSSAEARAANVLTGSRRQAEAAALFAHSLSFAATGPVFTLPDGYTVHSVSGLIEDNRWTGAPAQQPVPEPSLLMLAGSGLALGVVRALRRRR